jgi:DNA polymerase III epsilon subunit-like protein
MIFWDTETTGLLLPGIEDPKQQPRIIELAAVLLVNGEERATFTSLFSPGMALPAIITKITGLTDGDLVGAPKFVTKLPEIIDFWRSDPDNSSVAHNHPFDAGCLVFELRRCGWEHRFPYASKQIDTVPLSGGKKLENWSREVIKADAFVAQTHRALDDVRRLIECWKTL